MIRIEPSGSTLGVPPCQVRGSVGRQRAGQQRQAKRQQHAQVNQQVNQQGSRMAVACPSAAGTRADHNKGDGCRSPLKIAEPRGSGHGVLSRIHSGSSASDGIGAVQ